MSYTYKNATIHFDGSMWVADFDGGFAVSASKERLEAKLDRNPPKPRPAASRSIYCKIDGQPVRLA
jgi:hypothetical protein